MILILLHCNCDDKCNVHLTSTPWARWPSEKPTVSPDRLFIRIPSEQRQCNLSIILHARHFLSTLANHTHLSPQMFNRYSFINPIYRREDKVLEKLNSPSEVTQLTVSGARMKTWAGRFLITVLGCLMGPLLCVSNTQTLFHAGDRGKYSSLFLTHLCTATPKCSSDFSSDC
jgi:hypothetical protein